MKQKHYSHYTMCHGTESYAEHSLNPYDFEGDYSCVCYCTLCFGNCTGQFPVGATVRSQPVIMPLRTLDTDFFFYFKSGKSSVKPVQVVCLPTMSGKWSLTSVFGFLEDDIFPTTKMFLGLILGQWVGVTALINHGTRGHWNFYIFKGRDLWLWEDGTFVMANHVL